MDVAAFKNDNELDSRDNTVKVPGKTTCHLALPRDAFSNIRIPRKAQKAATMLKLSMPESLQHLDG